MALSRYRILERLGAGGMGTVYRADDLTLHRTVALKFLSPSAVSHAQGLARFLREARMAAGLNHPALCTIHEVGEVEAGDERALGAGEHLEPGTPYIVMELIEGRTLETMLRQSGTLKSDDLLRIALHIAEGMAAAHARGIVHRDLKPANVMITTDGRVKILDFGLAKPLEPAAADDPPGTAAATASAELTREGRVIGTAPYMSPEQAKGEQVDTRSDVFSFGVILYELATGTRPFRGTTTISTLAKIIEAEAEPIPESRADISLELRRIIRRCLQKKPDDRYNDTRDLVAALNALRQETISGSTRGVSGAVTTDPTGSWLRQRRSWAAGAAVMIFAAIAVGALVWPRAARPARFAPPTFRQITFTGAVSEVAVSPDGQLVAAVESGESGSLQLVVFDPSAGQRLTLFTGQRIRSLRWSPDGTELYAYTIDEKGGAAGYVFPRLGGTPRRVTSFWFMTWSPNGRQIAGAWVPSREIRIEDPSTGEKRTIPIDVPFTWIKGLDWSPNGELFALTTYDKTRGTTLWTILAGGGPPTRIVDAVSPASAQFSPLGDALYFLSAQRGSEASSLWTVKIDPKSGRPVSEPTVVLSGLEVDGSSPSFAISRDGRRLVYVRTATKANLWTAEPDYKAGGAVRTTQRTFGTSVDSAPKFSPDGRSVVFVRGGNLFTLPPDGAPPRQLTFGDLRHATPVWSPDGRTIAFASPDSGKVRVWHVGADGGDPRPFKGTVVGEDLAWSPGKKILYQKVGNQNYILLDPLSEEETPVLKDESTGWIFWPSYSPDGTRVAVSWNRAESPPRGYAQRIWSVSLDGSVQQLFGDGTSTGFPLGWSPDGAYVYVLTAETLTPSDTFTNPAIWKAPAGGGAAALLANLPFKEVALRGDLSPDGTRFVFSVVDTRADAWIVEQFDPRGR